MKKYEDYSLWDLVELLEKKYGKRFEADYFSLLLGGAAGSFDSKKIVISFESGKSLILSIPQDGKEVSDELLPTLTEVMGNEKPICSYDLQISKTEEKDSVYTIEWNVVAPEKRIKELVNGDAYSPESKIHNLTLYNGKCANDYLEKDKVKRVRIYGIDPGSIENVESINNLCEVELFFAIYELGKHIWNCNHNMMYGRIIEIDLTEEKYAYEYMIYQTTKFGVELPEPQIGKHIHVTPSYAVWYKFYADHFYHTLTDEQFEAFLMARKNGQDTSAFMPSGHWTDLLEKPSEKTFLNK